MTNTESEKHILFERAEEDRVVLSHILFQPDVDELKNLNPFSVMARYDAPPEINITREEIQKIVDTMASWCKEQINAN